VRFILLQPPNWVPAFGKKGRDKGKEETGMGEEEAVVFEHKLALKKVEGDR